MHGGSVVDQCVVDRILGIKQSCICANIKTDDFFVLFG